MLLPKSEPPVLELPENPPKRPPDLHAGGPEAVVADPKQPADVLWAVFGVDLPGGPPPKTGTGGPE